MVGGVGSGVAAGVAAGQRAVAAADLRPPAPFSPQVKFFCCLHIMYGEGQVEGRHCCSHLWWCMSVLVSSASSTTLRAEQA